MSEDRIIYIGEDLEVGGGNHSQWVINSRPVEARGWSEPYKKSGSASYRRRVVCLPYPPVEICSGATSHGCEVVIDLTVAYPDLRPWKLEPHYCFHVGKMTEEELHSKADIATQLAFRDQTIEELRRIITRTLASGQLEKLEDALP